jgi:hypothetical protein
MDANPLTLGTSLGPCFVRVARYPPEGNPIQLPRTALRDRALSRRDKQMRMIASFIIHYVGWQAERGFLGHMREIAIMANFPKAEMVTPRKPSFSIIERRPPLAIRPRLM